MSSTNLRNNEVEFTPIYESQLKFAADLLIPEVYNSRIVDAQSQQDILDIANELGIAPGIVVGRYHHLTKKWNRFTELIRKLEWKNNYT